MQNSKMSAPTWPTRKVTSPFTGVEYVLRQPSPQKLAIYQMDLTLRTEVLIDVPILDEKGAPAYDEQRQPKMRKQKTPKLERADWENMKDIVRNSVVTPKLPDNIEDLGADIDFLQGEIMAWVSELNKQYIEFFRGARQGAANNKNGE